MPSRFQYSAVQIHEFVKAPKCVREGQTAEFRRMGERRENLSVDLDLIDGGFVDLRLFVNAEDTKEPERRGQVWNLAVKRLQIGND